jgi:hypothetical protein
MKFKMAATAGLNLTLDPMGKCFKTLLLWNTWTIETKLPRNDHWKVLCFYADRKSKIIYSSLKLLHWLNLNCASIIGRSFTNFVFFMLIVIPRWLPLQDIVLHRTQSSKLGGRPKPVARKIVHGCIKWVVPQVRRACEKKVI